MRFLPPLAWLAAALLAAAGVTFIVAPEFALANLDHTRDGLPIVFGGRYLGLGLAIALFAYLRGLRGLGVMSAAGFLMAAVDAVTYFNAGEPLSLIAPHAIVAVIAGIVAISVFRSSNSKSLAR